MIAWVTPFLLYLYFYFNNVLRFYKVNYDPCQYKP